MNLEEFCFQIIVTAGDARSLSMEAIESAKNNKYDQADNYLDKASAAFGKAHNLQTELLQKEAQGNETNVSILLIHAQDHLMTGMAVYDLAKEFIDIYKRIDKKI